MLCSRRLHQRVEFPPGLSAGRFFSRQDTLLQPTKKTHGVRPGARSAQNRGSPLTMPEHVTHLYVLLSYSLPVRATICQHLVKFASAVSGQGMVSRGGAGIKGRCSGSACRATKAAKFGRQSKKSGSGHQTLKAAKCVLRPRRHRKCSRLAVGCSCILCLAGTFRCVVGHLL